MQESRTTLKHFTGIEVSFTWVPFTWQQLGLYCAPVSQVGKVRSISQCPETNVHHSDGPCHLLGDNSHIWRQKECKNGTTSHGAMNDQGAYLTGKASQKKGILRFREQWDQLHQVFWRCPCCRGKHLTHTDTHTQTWVKEHGVLSHETLGSRN